MLISGLRTDAPVRLSEFAELLPAQLEVSKPLVESLAKNPLDFGVLAIFLPLTSSQIHVQAGNPQDLAMVAWNSQWDAMLLSAIFDCDAAINIQSHAPAEEICSDSKVYVTNHHLQGLSGRGVYTLTPKDLRWLTDHYSSARKLLDEATFMNAVAAMGSYRWNPRPSAQLAVIWSGIESLFRVESEISFRTSLYIARYLQPVDAEARKTQFETARMLYRERSKAVHGATKAKQKSGVDPVQASASLLQTLLRRCSESGAVPDTGELAP